MKGLSIIIANRKIAKAMAARDGGGFGKVGSQKLQTPGRRIERSQIVEEAKVHAGCRTLEEEEEEK